MAEEVEMGDVDGDTGVVVEMQKESPASKDEPEMSFEARLLEQVKCHICTEVLYNPVILHFCGHVFCGGCAKPWLAMNLTCPICRSQVARVTADFRAQNLLDLFLQLNPDKVRSPEEMQELDAQHKRGDDVQALGSQADNQIPVALRRHYDEEEEEDDDDGIEEGYSEDEERVTRWQIQPCRWCNPQNDRGFVCPNPLLDPGFEVVPPAHYWCEFCSNLFPEVEALKQACGLCGARSCHSMNPDCMTSELKMFKDGFVELADDANDTSLITSAFFNRNEAEFMRFMRHKWVNGMTLNHLKTELENYYQRYPEAMEDGPHGQVTPDSMLCYGCRRTLFLIHINDWWAEQVNDLKTVPDDRQKCWYGVECRTQYSKIRHREIYNHLGPWIPADQR